MMQDAAQLGLEARASQDIYGAGPQTFPYVSFFPEPLYGGGGGGASVSRRTHTFMNLGFAPSNVNEDVRIRGGIVYCGTQDVEIESGVGPYGPGDVYLNVTVGMDGAFHASLAGSASGDLSILLYRITDTDLEDYVSGTMFIPYYN